MTENTDLEIDAMATVSRALTGLDDQARGRVIRWVSERYGIALASGRASNAFAGSAGGGSDAREQDDEAGVELPDEGSGWAHFAELYDAADANTHPEGMLIAAYWVQVVQGRDSFGSFELNKLLKDLGHGVTGTAKVMSTLIAKKPALILQLKKSGKSQQARKTYRLTEAGKKAVAQMLANAA